MGRRASGPGRTAGRQSRTSDYSYFLTFDLKTGNRGPAGFGALMGFRSRPAGKPDSGVAFSSRANAGALILRMNVHSARASPSSLLWASRQC